MRPVILQAWSRVNSKPGWPRETTALAKTVDMPQPAFHLQLANDFLLDWSDTPATCPFDITSCAQRRAFLHGSIGPDMGLFPGARHDLAVLAHRGPTGELIRAMLACAQNETELAFSYGWASHIFIDALVHPYVNATAAA